MKTLILGGIRSGKSALAEQCAVKSGKPVVYVATAHPDDAEMRARIESHRQRRPASWTLVEEPLRLAPVLERYGEGHSILVECLTLWLTNLLLSEDRSHLRSEQQALFDIVSDLASDVIFVGNESNMGIVPLGELSRTYCDEAGNLHQTLAALCDTVVLTIAGLPQILKGELT